MKRSLHPLALLLLLCPLSSMAQDLDTILELNAKAHGGADNWAKIENVRMELELTGPDLKATVTYVATREGNVRMDYTIGGHLRVFSEGLYDNKAWKWSPIDEKVQPQTAVDAAALRHDFEMPGLFFTLQDMKGRGATVTLQGVVEDGNSKQWQVRVTLADGFSRDFFIDQETHRIVRERDRRVVNPASDEKQVVGLVETRYQGGQLIDDVLYFDRKDETNVESGELFRTTKVQSIEHNVDIKDAYFEPGN